MNELWGLVAEWMTLRGVRDRCFDHAQRVAPSPEAAESAKDFLDFDGQAWEARWKVLDAASDLAAHLGNAAPRSLLTFVAHLRPHGDEQKAVDLWPEVQADLHAVALAGEQADVKTDTQKKPEKVPRPLTARAAACGRAFKKAQKKNKSLKLRHFVEEWARENDSVEGIYKSLIANPAAWKTDI